MLHAYYHGFSPLSQFKKMLLMHYQYFTFWVI